MTIVEAYNTINSYIKYVFDCIDEFNAKGEIKCFKSLIDYVISNQVNIDNSPVLDRESRMRVVEAVKGIMSTLNLKNEPKQIQEISEFEENEEDSNDDIVHIIEQNN